MQHLLEQQCTTPHTLLSFHHNAKRAPTCVRRACNVITAHNEIFRQVTDNGDYIGHNSLHLCLRVCFPDHCSSHPESTLMRFGRHPLTAFLTASLHPTEFTMVLTWDTIHHISVLKFASGSFKSPLTFTQILLLMNTWSPVVGHAQITIHLEPLGL